MVPLWMFPMAIACGNTFILKPSEKVPSASIRMAELFKEAGPARRRIQCRARRQGGRGRHPEPLGHPCRVLRRLHPDRQVHLRNRRAQRQARAGAGRGEEPRRGAARRRPGVHRGCAHRRRVRLGGRALHGDQRRGGGGRRGRPFGSFTGTKGKSDQAVHIMPPCSVSSINCICSSVKSDVILIAQSQNFKKIFFASSLPA